MSRITATTRAGSDRASLYDEITSKIVADWKPGAWPGFSPGRRRPQRHRSPCRGTPQPGAQYSKINVLILGAVIERSYSTQSWPTFRHALGLGGDVRAVRQLSMPTGRAASRGAAKRPDRTRSQGKDSRSAERQGYGCSRRRRRLYQGLLPS